jgi:hypothetical protein
MNKAFLVRTAERAAKTFLQAYLMFWMLQAGLGDTTAEHPGDAFDLLFTWDNVKAGVVALALSVASSLISKPVGPSPDSPSVVG